MQKSSTFSRRDFLKSSLPLAIALTSAPVLTYGATDNYATTVIPPFSHPSSPTFMAYEWKFKPRPYSDEEAKTLLKNLLSPETTDWHYNTHHKGYVTFLNKIEAGLPGTDKSAANGNWSDFGELKRRQTWNHAGTVLHDVYWEVLGGDGDTSKGKEVVAAIEKEFGSLDTWKADFKATAIATKLSGWSVLTLDQLYSGRLLNVLVDEHHYGAIWGGIPLISCDMFEHAYYHKDGPARAKYVDNFFASLHWGRINARYTKFAK